MSQKLNKQSGIFTQQKKKKKTMWHVPMQNVRSGILLKNNSNNILSSRIMNIISDPFGWREGKFLVWLEGFEKREGEYRGIKYFNHFKFKMRER